ncbi:hypothetical protein ACUH9H_08465 [Dermabacteraceae bacterium P13128]
MNDRTETQVTSSRRAVAKGAMWAAPALVVASAAPAFASSQECDVQVARPVSAGDLRNVTFNGPDGLKVTGTVVSHDSELSVRPIGSPNMSVTSGGGVTLGQVADYGQYQEVRFEFSKPVYNLRFVIRDIDNQWENGGDGYVDSIVIDGDVHVEPVRPGSLVVRQESTGGTRISASQPYGPQDVRDFKPFNPRGQALVTNRGDAPVTGFTLRYENTSTETSRAYAQFVYIAPIEYTSSNCTPK